MKALLHAHYPTFWCSIIRPKKLREIIKTQHFSGLFRPKTGQTDETFVFCAIKKMAYPTVRFMGLKGHGAREREDCFCLELRRPDQKHLVSIHCRIRPVPAMEGERFIRRLCSVFGWRVVRAINYIPPSQKSPRSWWWSTLPHQHCALAVMLRDAFELR